MMRRTRNYSCAFSTLVHLSGRMLYQCKSYLSMALSWWCRVLKLHHRLGHRFSASDLKYSAFHCAAVLDSQLTWNIRQRFRELKDEAAQEFDHPRATTATDTTAPSTQFSPNVSVSIPRVIGARTLLIARQEEDKELLTELLRLQYPTMTDEQRSQEAQIFEDSMDSLSNLNQLLYQESMSMTDIDIPTRIGHLERIDDCYKAISELSIVKMCPGAAEIFADRRRKGPLKQMVDLLETGVCGLP